MDEDKKKKKNKKKKNKQAKASEDTKVTGGETKVSELNHASASEKSNNTHVSEDADIRSTGEMEPDANPVRDPSNSTVRANLDEHEKRRRLQNEVILEEKIKHLEIERHSCMEKEVILEKEITNLHKEKDSWLQKEASMDQTLKELTNEKTDWTLKVSRLEDRITQLENDKESWVLKEKATTETIDRLTKEFMEVDAQVKVLQESRDSLLQENQLLTERITVLQSLVQHLEQERTSSASSSTKTDQVVAENTQIIENVKDSDPVVTDIDMSDKMSNLGEKVEESNARESIRSSVTEEIVQIPLHETEIREVEVEQNVIVEDKGDDIALTDAPLTGAPFRFISFVARYVSGADLVNKSNSNSGR